MTFSAISLPGSDQELIVDGENVDKSSEIELTSMRLRAYFLSSQGNFATMSR
jgi:hypothetical protein